MRILTVVKRVPDSRAVIKVKPDGDGIETVGLKYVCDPFDEIAVAEAIQLRQECTDVKEIVALGVGSSETVEVLWHALAMGVDRAVHVCGSNLPEYDEVYLAGLVAATIGQKHGYQLILCGKQNIDNDAGEMGPALAEFLGLPHVGAVTKLRVLEDGASLCAHRRIEGAEEIVDTPLPTLITCEKGLIEPRPPALPKLMKAKKMPVETINVADLGRLDFLPTPAKLLKLAPLPPTPRCRMIDGQPDEMARELVRLLRDEVRVF